MENLTILVLIASSLFSAGKSATSDLLIIISSLLMAITWFLVKSRNFVIRQRDKILFVVVLLFLFLNSFSVINSISFHTSYRVWAFLGVTLMFTYTSSIFFDTDQSRKKLITSLILLTGAISTITCAYYLFGFKPSQGDISLFFPTYGHNRFAEFFLPLFPFSLFLLSDHNTKWFIKLAIVLSITNFILSFSRASLLAVFLFSTIVFATSIVKNKNIKQVLKILFFGSLTVMIIFIPVWVTSNGFNPKSPPLLYILNKPLTSTDRITFYTDALSKWSRRMIIGYGQGTYTYTAPNRWVNTQSTIHVHNHLIQTLYDSGLIGLTGEAILLFYLLAKISRSIRKPTDKLILIGVCISFIQAQFDYGWEIPIVFLANMIFLFSLFRSSKADDKIINPNKLLFFKVTIFITTSALAILCLTEISSIRLDKVNSPKIDDIDSAYEEIKKADDSIYLQDSINISSFAPIINAVSTEPMFLNIKKRFNLIERITKRYEPHDLFWIKPDELRSSTLKIVNDLLTDKESSTLSNNQMAQINYWQYTKMLVNGEREYREYQQYLDRAVELDPNNQKYLEVSKVNKDLGGLNINDLSDDIDRLKGKLNVTEKPTIYLALLDHIYMKLADIKMLAGEYDEEIENRILAISGTKSPTAYILLAKRLKILGRVGDSQIYLKECVSLYPQCETWYQAER